MPELEPPEEDRAPVETWTDDEWLASMAKFPPNERIDVCERWIAEQRKSAGGF